MLAWLLLLLALLLLPSSAVAEPECASRQEIQADYNRAYAGLLEARNAMLAEINAEANEQIIADQAALYDRLQSRLKALQEELASLEGNAAEKFAESMSIQGRMGDARSEYQSQLGANKRARLDQAGWKAASAKRQFEADVANQRAQRDRRLSAAKDAQRNRSCAPTGGAGIRG